MVVFLVLSYLWSRSSTLTVSRQRTCSHVVTYCTRVCARATCVRTCVQLMRLCRPNTMKNTGHRGPLPRSRGFGGSDSPPM
nr:MAG TPA: hypothetical protein [Microviridae sp.]